MNKMKRCWIRMLTIILSLSLVLPVVPFGFSDAGKRFAKMTHLVGEVVLQKGGELQFKAFEGMSVSEGDRVTTGIASAVTLELDDGKIVKIADNTKVDVAELRKSISGGNTAGLKLWGGKVLVDIKQKLGNDEKFEIKTPTAVMGVRGTLFFASHTGRVTEVGVLEGSVKLTTLPRPRVTSKTVIVMPNQIVRVVIGVDGAPEFVPRTITSARMLDWYILQVIKQQPGRVDPALLLDLDKIIEQKRLEQMEIDEQLRQQAVEQKNLEARQWNPDLNGSTSSPNVIYPGEGDLSGPQGISLTEATLAPAVSGTSTSVPTSPQVPVVTLGTLPGILYDVQGGNNMAYFTVTNSTQVLVNTSDSSTVDIKTPVSTDASGGYRVEMIAKKAGSVSVLIKGFNGDAEASKSFTVQVSPVAEKLYNLLQAPTEENMMAGFIDLQSAQTAAGRQPIAGYNPDNSNAYYALITADRVLSAPTVVSEATLQNQIVNFVNTRVAQIEAFSPASPATLTSLSLLSDLKILRMDSALRDAYVSKITMSEIADLDAAIKIQQAVDHVNVEQVITTLSGTAYTQSPGPTGWIQPVTTTSALVVLPKTFYTASLKYKTESYSVLPSPLPINSTPHDLNGVAVTRLSGGFTQYNPQCTVVRFCIQSGSVEDTNVTFLLTVPPIESPSTPISIVKQ